MKTFAVMLGLGMVALATGGSPASAQERPWCVMTMDRDGGVTSCGYYTWEQCRAAASGVGLCIPNGAYAAAATQPHAVSRPRPTRRH